MQEKNSNQLLVCGLLSTKLNIIIYMGVDGPFGHELNIMIILGVGGSFGLDCTVTTWGEGAGGGGGGGGGKCCK